MTKKTYKNKLIKRLQKLLALSRQEEDLSWLGNLETLREIWQRCSALLSSEDKELKVSPKSVRGTKISIEKREEGKSMQESGNPKTQGQTQLTEAHFGVRIWEWKETALCGSHLWHENRNRNNRNCSTAS